MRKRRPQPAIARSGHEADSALTMASTISFEGWLVHNVTGKNGYSSIEGLFNQMAQEIPAFNGVTWAALGDKVYATSTVIATLADHV